MTTMTAPDGERLSRLEGAYEHLATKADIANLETRIANLETRIANLKTDLVQSQRWTVGIVLTGLVMLAAFLKLA